MWRFCMFIACYCIYLFYLFIYCTLLMLSDDIGCVFEQKEHSPLPGVVLAFL